MILLKEITMDNFQQFKGLPSDILVVESKEGPVRMKHKFYMVGIIVCMAPGLFRIQFSNGKSSGFELSVGELIKTRSDLYRFFYIEIKP
jgi:hypothetical protein